MKKIINILLIITLLLLSSCSKKEVVLITGEIIEEDFVFNINNKSVKLNQIFKAEEYGEYGYYEMPSCGYSGFDKVFTYDDFEVNTYPQGNSDYVLYIDLFEEASTARGIKIGDNKQTLLSKYPNDYKQFGNYISYSLNKSQLLFYIENDIIEEIEYAYGDEKEIISIIDPVSDPDYTQRLPKYLDDYVLSIGPYDEQIDGLTNGLLSSIITEQMDDKEKLKVIYDWIVENITYKSNPDYSFKDDPDSYMASACLETLTLFTGNCFNYAALEVYLANKLNIPTILIIGEGINRDMGYSLHCWTLMYIDNKWYHFDPCYEQLFDYTREFYLVNSDAIYNDSHRWDIELYPQ